MPFARHNQTGICSTLGKHFRGLKITAWRGIWNPKPSPALRQADKPHHEQLNQTSGTACTNYENVWQDKMYPQLEENDSVVTWRPMAIALKQFQKHIRHVLMIIQMKACIVQMGIPVSCTEPSGLMKESIYSVVLGQPQKKVPLSVSTVVMKALFFWTYWSIHIYTYGIGD